jgi:rhodanese-related sulfurtransferase
MNPIAKYSARRAVIFLAVLAVFFIVLSPVQAQCPTPTIFQTSLLEPNQPGTEITTEQLQQILAAGLIPVLDVRFPQEYAISHIPGAINIPPDSAADPTNVQHETAEIAARYSSSTPIVLTCNGPFCGKSKRVAKALKDNYGFQQNLLFRYQLGLPVWRALGNTVQTDMDGFAYIFNRDFTSVFVDARKPEALRADTVACAVNIQPGEANAANDDGRLPLLDKGARIVVFGDDPQLAKTVASEIAKKAYWSSSYFSGTFEDLKNSRQIQIHSQRRCRSAQRGHAERDSDD